VSFDLRGDGKDGPILNTIMLSNHTVAPEAEAAVVGSLALPSASSAVAFALEEDPSARFEIVGSELRLRRGRALRATEPDFAHRVRIRATHGPYGTLGIHGIHGTTSVHQDFQIVRDDFLTNGVVAHRGAWKHGRGAENSMTAFRDAMAKGCAHFECDVHLSQDDQVVVAHGPRATKDVGFPIVATSSFDVLSRVPLGNGDFVPLLGDVLDEVMRQNRTRVVLDIKGTPGGGKNDLLATTIASIVRDKAAQAWVSYISAAYDMLLRIIAVDASARCAPLEDIHPLATYVADGMWGVDFKHGALDAATVQRFQAAGLTVNTWTPNTMTHLLAAQGWGADLITTDEPERLLAMGER
jgi:glycerophosphoryl diester phosphodiesterase